MEQISSQGVLKGTYTKLACLFVYLITGSHGWIYLRKKKKKEQYRKQQYLCHQSWLDVMRTQKVAKMMGVKK